MLDLEAIKKRNAARSPGEWTHGLDCDPPDSAIESSDEHGTASVCHIQCHGNINTVTRTGEEFSHADARFIAGCSLDVPALIAEVERLRAILTQNPDDCPLCFGEGEELHLGPNGKLFETGACKACKGTGFKQDPK